MTTIESLVRYRLLSEPELCNLFKTTLSNSSLQSSKYQQKPIDDASPSDLNAAESLIKEQKSPRLDDNDNNSQNRHNNNLVQTWRCFFNFMDGQLWKFGDSNVFFIFFLENVHEFFFSQKVQMTTWNFENSWCKIIKEKCLVFAMQVFECYIARDVSDEPE